MRFSFHICSFFLGLWVVLLIFLTLDQYYGPFKYNIIDRGLYNLEESVERDRRYAIDTLGCKIPELDPFDASIENFTQKPPPFHCPCENGFGLTYLENDVLRVNADILQRFSVVLGKDSAKNFNCCMWAMYRREVEEQDNFMRYSSECVRFQNSVTFLDEYSKVECYLKGQLIHETFHINLIQKPNVEERCEDAPKNCATHEKMGVIILFLDSVSRINFRRNFPESRKVLIEELKAIEMHGYNRVADNTFPNLVALLTGMSEEQLRETCWKNETDYFDDCKFIWKDFATNGFRTAFVEDYPDIGAFNFEKSGFRQQPTDYYGHNFLKEAYKLMFNQRDCLNGISETEMIFKWCHDFMKFFQNQKHFGLFATSRFTHADNINRANLADPILKKYLRMMKYDGLLKNTFLFIISDHGSRYGEFRETIVGGREVNLPAFYVVLPDSVEKQFPQVFQNLHENAYRLTTPFDLHETLRDIVSCNFAPSSPNNDVKSQAISLFQKIPATRTCPEVGIPIGFCACYVSEINLKHDSDIAHKANKLLIAKLNNITDAYRKLCAMFVPEYILRAREIHFLLPNNDIEIVYEITFGIEPGSGLFQGIVTKGPDMNSLVAQPEISRLDVYGKTSACIANNILDTYYAPAEHIVVDFSVSKLNRNVADKSYAINTVGCKIPELDPYDESIRSFTKKLPPFHCPCENGFGLTYLDNNILRVNADILSRFQVDLAKDPAEDFYCCMWTMYRHEIEEQENFMRFPKECVRFVKSVPIHSEYLKAECYLKDQRIYETFHVNLIRKPKVEERCGSAPKKCPAHEKMGVIVLFLDSVSRMNFRRNLPESRKILLEELEAIEMHGYNRVADNTFPNLVSLLTGMSEAELHETCWKNEADYFDDCKFIWQYFATSGFRTAFVEDYPDIAAFNFEKSGFKQQPTDYYGHNFLKEAYKLMFKQRDCLNEISETEMTFKWCHDFMKLFQNQKHFGLFATSRFTHDDNINRANLADPILKQYLRMMKYDGLLENTFLFIISDHGSRFGEFRETIVGGREVNLPAFYVVLPDSFKSQFPQAFQNIRENAHRLTTPFDLHETLRDIVTCNFDPSIPNSDSVNRDGTKRQATSLFRNIPETRTCLDVGIPRGYCACYVLEINLKHDLDIVQRALQLLIAKLNSFTESYRKSCAAFLPNNIFRSREIHFLNRNNSIEVFYEIMFGVKPGDGLFQGIVTRDSDLNSLSAEMEISRLDMYGNTSACVAHNSMLRKYCYCL